MFVSYAQNFEDVMLWRALHEVDDGFYIDIGAGDPDAESVTRAFYERGWRGINVEPSPQTYPRLVARRPQDVNIRAAAVDRVGDVPFFAVDGGNGLSTIVEPVAALRRADGWSVPDALSVDGDTLANICRRYAADRPIHFLKIDVEGAEREVILGADFTVFRPWIVVVESEGPWAAGPDEREFEPPLLGADYRRMYFDGLNCFYVASEHADRLKAPFSVPPNVYDRFASAAQVEAEARAGSAAEQIIQLQAAAEQRDSELRSIGTQVHSLTAEVSAGVAHLKHTQEQLGRAAEERASFVQQLFESARYEAWLAQERARLVMEVSQWQAFQRQVLASRSWRMTGFLRRVGRALRRRSQAGR